MRVILPPVRHAATDEFIRRTLVQRNIGVEPPQLIAVTGIDRDNVIERVADDERIIDQYRGALRNCAVHPLCALLDITGTELPRDFQPVDIVSCYLDSRAESVTARIIAIVVPTRARQLKTRLIG